MATLNKCSNRGETREQWAFSTTTRSKQQNPFKICNFNYSYQLNIIEQKPINIIYVFIFFKKRKSCIKGPWYYLRLIPLYEPSNQNFNQWLKNFPLLLLLQHHASPVTNSLQAFTIYNGLKCHRRAAIGRRRRN